jgi:threonine/homoserine/homoserine lactone efflux protein
VAILVIVMPGQDTALVVRNAAFARLGHTLRRPAVRRAIDGVTGAVLVAFGIRLAATKG